MFSIIPLNDFYCIGTHSYAAACTIARYWIWVRVCMYRVLNQYSNKMGRVYYFSTLYLISWSLLNLGCKIDRLKWLLLGFKYLISSLCKDFRNFTPAWSFVYYSKAIFCKNDVLRSFHTYLKMFEENNTVKLAQKAGLHKF